jgi:LysR family transcriptional regulator, transcriptional activator of the cysJI operon
MENFRIMVFLAVAEQASFRKASEHLHLSQPAVSQHVRALEEELGVPLFDRTGNRVQLTDAGKILMEYARKCVRLAHETRAAIGEITGTPQGTLRIGASTTVAQYVLPRLLGKFQQLHPKIRLTVVSGNTEDVVAKLGSGSIDVGMIEGPPLTKDLHVEPFLEDELVLVAPASEEWAGSEEIALKDLANLPLLVREHGSGTRRVVEQALQAKGFPMSKMRIAMELDSTEAIVATVEAGLGLGFVSTWAVRKELQLETVVQLRVKGLKVRRQFTLIRPLGPDPTGSAGTFWRFAVEQNGKQSEKIPKLIP